MAKIVKRRRGTTAEHAVFKGALGEITIDMDKDTVVVHDDDLLGGFPLASIMHFFKIVSLCFQEYNLLG